MAEGKVYFGVSRLVYALDDANGGVGDTWVEVPGAVSIEVSSEDSTNTFYADNTGYWISSSSASDSFSIEVARLSLKHLQELLGHEKDSVSGGTFESVNAKRPTFSLGFQYEGDTDTIRGIKYGCTLNRPTETHNTTTDSTDPDTITIEGGIVGKKFTVNGEQKQIIGGRFLSSDTNHAGYDAFYTQPPQPGVAPAAA